MFQFLAAGTDRPLQKIIRPAALDILLLRVKFVHKVHALLVDGEDDAAAHDEAGEAGQGAAPEGEQALVAEDEGGAAEAVAVDAPGVDALHARLDRVQGLGGEDGDGAGQAADTERGHDAELLPRRRVRLGQLLQRRVAPEPHGGVGGLPRGGGHQALEEAAQPALAGDDGHGVEEAAHARVGALPVVDQRRLDGLGRRHRQQGLGHAGPEPGQHVPRARHAALGVRQQPLVLLERHEPDRRLGRVPDNRRRAPGVPLSAERRPGQLRAVREVAVELRSRLRDCGGRGERRGRGAVSIGCVSFVKCAHIRLVRMDVQSAGYVIAVREGYSVSYGPVQLLRGTLNTAMR